MQEAVQKIVEITRRSWGENDVNVTSRSSGICNPIAVPNLSGRILYGASVICLGVVEG